jgi:transcriptional regulator with XRE-family HTH domain
MDDVNIKSSRPLGPKIAKLRALKGWSQVEFGKRLGGMSGSVVSRLEKCEKIELEVLKQVCKILDITIEGIANFDEGSVLYLTPKSNAIEEISKFYEKRIQQIKEELGKELAGK